MKFAVCCGLLLLTVVEIYALPNYFDDAIEEDAAAGLSDPGDYSDNAIDNLMHAMQQKRAGVGYVYRRSCVRRNGNCDHRPNDCCFSSSCRCNLWGSNCRCQRVGLFQKWGK